MRPLRRLVVLDVDSTLTRDEGIDLLAGYISPETRTHVAEITAAAMRGEMDFEASLRARVRALAGITTDQIASATTAVRLTDGARELVATLHDKGHLVGAVSGGFHQMIDPLAEELGLDFHHANTLEIRDGILTGELTGNVVDARAKADTLCAWAQSTAVAMSDTVAVGDGGNDVEMLREAGLGIAFVAKPVAREAADVAIDTPDLRLVLQAMGLSD